MGKLQKLLINGKNKASPGAETPTDRGKSWGSPDFKSSLPSRTDLYSFRFVSCYHCKARAGREPRSIPLNGEIK